MMLSNFYLWYRYYGPVGWFSGAAAGMTLPWYLVTRRLDVRQWAKVNQD
jgi:hypothetical protein